MRDGIYKVTLQAGEMKGLIIGALHDGQITGCDKTHFVTGTYTHNGARISGVFVMQRHTQRDDVVEIANLDDITAHFSGICGDCFGELDAVVKGRPDLKVKATFRKICEN